MQDYLDALIHWARQNDMLINSAKTKEMIMGRVPACNVPQLTTEIGQIERVHFFKLLGVYVDDSISWNSHIEYITAKAAKRLYFLKILKRSGLSHQCLRHFYIAAIRPILEYCSVVWGHNLSQKQSSQLESIQKRAARLIYEVTRNMPYNFVLCYSDLSSLEVRRIEHAESFF